MAVAVAGTTRPTDNRKVKEMVRPLNKRGRALRHFYEHITVRTDDCMIWPFSVTGEGYGVVTIDGQRHYVHRLACEYGQGYPKSPNILALHTCRNRSCWNPNHLAWGNHHTNNVTDRIRDGIKPGGSGRGHKGEKR